MERYEWSWMGLCLFEDWNEGKQRQRKHLKRTTRLVLRDWRSQDSARSKVCKMLMGFEIQCICVIGKETLLWLLLMQRWN